MTKVNFQGQQYNTTEDLPEAGTSALEFILTKPDLKDVTLSDFKGKNIVLNIFPSIDTPVCQASVRRFNEIASQLPNTVVLCVSADLPFAQQRFCGAEGLNNVIPVSEFRFHNFGDNYGVRISEGPLKGLLSRAVLLIDPAAKIIHAEQVKDLGQEPDYDAVIQALR